MFEHRLVQPNQITVIPFDPPFSSFQYIDANYQYDSSEYGNSAIRRLFSLGRSHEAHTLMTEEIDPAGIISDENDEINQYFSDYQMTGLRRISFWKSNFTADNIETIQESDCLGYAILKRDQCPSKNCDRWHVFEAVFKKYDHKHNYVPNPHEYQVTLATKKVNIKGLLFAQQNGLNKRCAQVALRSIISRIRQRDVSYREINEYAQKVPPTFTTPTGLTAKQIQAVLRGFKIPFRDIDYIESGKGARKRYPYQKFVYSGIESGVGALLGFRLSGPAITGEARHIIPFYGHTFNKDTWAPEADKSYFKVGEKLGYLPSENWTSSFLGHDDNFGPNFCVPRLYISPKQVEYVVELLKPGIVFSGSQAEVLSLQFLYSVLGRIDPSQNEWLKRMVFYASRDIQRIVLRAVPTNREKYAAHLANETDWENNHENQAIINVLRKSLPKHLWIVEVSIPELFPANQRKLGDIVLNGGIKLSPDKKDRSNFVLVRLPSLYLFDFSLPHQKPRFLAYPSALLSHYPVFSLN